MKVEQLKALQEQYEIPGQYKNKKDRAAAIWEVIDGKRRELMHMEDDEHKKAEAEILGSSSSGEEGSEPVAPVSLRNRAKKAKAKK